MGITFLRTIILYIMVVACMRVMGKRQIGELQPSELVVAIMVSDLASIPMQNLGTPLISGVLPILTLVVMEVMLSFISIKSKRFEQFISGKPSILVYNGKAMPEEMKRLRFTEDDLKEELRIAGSQNIEEVQYAILETNGQMSLILKPEYRPLTLKNAENLIKEAKDKCGQ